MFSNLTFQLLILMLGTALAGLVIGICIARLRALGRQRKMQREHKALLASKDAEVEAIRQERDIVFQALQSQEKDSLESRTVLEKTQAQHEALQVHARLQAQRLQTLQTQLQSAEEKNIVLQRDFGNYKLIRSRELRSLHASSGVDSRLPLLNKRASGDQAGVGQSDHYSTGIDKEFPSIAESELPNSLELEEVAIVDDGSSDQNG